MKENKYNIENALIDLLNHIDKIISTLNSDDNKNSAEFIEAALDSYITTCIEKIPQKFRNKNLDSLNIKDNIHTFYLSLKENFKGNNYTKKYFLNIFKDQLLSLLCNILKSLSNLSKKTTDTKERIYLIKSYLSSNMPNFPTSPGDSPSEIKKIHDFLYNLLYKAIDTNNHINDSSQLEYFGVVINALLLESSDYFTHIPNRNMEESPVRPPADINIWLPVRGKSHHSIFNNFQKEASKAISSENLEKNSFDESSLTKDFMAASLVLLDIDPAINLSLYTNDPKVKNLKEQREIYIKEINKFHEEVAKAQTTKDYYTIKKELLAVLANASSDKFKQEYNGVASFNDALNSTEEILNNISTAVGKRPIQEDQRAELIKLLDYLRWRKDDKFQFAFLKDVIIPQFNNSELLKALNVKINYIKTLEKSNRFAAHYCMVETPFGIIELQLLTEYGYRHQKTNHGDLFKKNFPKDTLFDLFEPTDPNISPEDFKNILEDLNSSFDCENSEYVENLLQKVKLRDYMVLNNSYYDFSPEKKMSIDEYLLMLASYYSPVYSINVTRNPKSCGSRLELGIDDLATRFSDFLRQEDRLSELAKMLYRRIKSYTTLSKEERKQFGTYLYLKDKLLENISEEERKIYLQNLNELSFSSTPFRVDVLLNELKIMDLKNNLPIIKSEVSKWIDTHKSEWKNENKSVEQEEPCR